MIHEGVVESPYSSEGVVDRLRTEHLDLERKLDELNSHIYLTPEEQVERKRIQKLKLLKKDQIQMLVSRGGNA